MSQLENLTPAKAQALRVAMGRIMRQGKLSRDWSKPADKERGPATVTEVLVLLGKADANEEVKTLSEMVFRGFLSPESKVDQISRVIRSITTGQLTPQ